MKKSKVSLAFVAVLFGIGAAFTTTQNAFAKQSDVLWGQLGNGTWVQTTIGARCNTSTKICKENFPAGQNPNLDSAGGTVITANGQLN